jgi:hypothetical protein
MNLKPIEIEHGERYGNLTVLEKVISRKRGPKYKCGCACGYQPIYLKARQLMKGEVTACLRCCANTNHLS